MVVDTAVVCSIFITSIKLKLRDVVYNMHMYFIRALAARDDP